MHYALVFTSLFVTIYIYISLQFTTNKLTVRPNCNALCTCIYKFVCNHLYFTSKTSLQLGRFAMHYTLVFTSLFVTIYISAQQTSLQLGRFAMHYTLVFTSWFVTIYISQQTS